MDYEEQIVRPEAIEAAQQPQVAAEQAPEHAPEHEDDRGGDRVAAGHDVGVGADQRATALRGTRHRTANLGMGTQVGPDGRPTGAPAGHTEGRVADAAHVKVVAAKGAPIELAPGTVPAEADLFERVTTGGHAVTQRSGSPATPNVEPTMKPHNLYINGAPTVEDVRQGGLGDCYFLSCLLGVTQNDPAKIMSVMSMTGDVASVTLQRFDARTGTHKPVTLRTGTGLMSRRSRSGAVSLVGAGMRIAPEPEVAKWWAEVHGNTVTVHRQDVYQTALWAPMMEKAYADFAQQFGPEGHGRDAEQRRLGSGYRIINAGGAAEYCSQMFYGDAATPTSTGTHFTPGSDIVATNVPAIQDLLRYEAQRGNTAAGTTQRFMHARIGAEGAVTRGVGLIDQVTGLLFSQQLGDDLGAALTTETMLEQIQRLLRRIDRNALRTALATLRTTLAAFPATSTTSDVATAAEPVQTPDAFPHLWDESMPAPFRHLRENLGILINLGDDSSPGRRQNYASHAYQVRSVSLKDATGGALALSAADLPARAGEIDAEQSQVMMHNPHATNEPDLRGTGPADGVDDGMFAYTLGQFLRNFDLLRFCDVSR